MPKVYNRDLDVRLSKVKVKNDKEGYMIEVRSYDGGEPRVTLTRHYCDSAGQWRKDLKTKYPRLSFRLLRWLIENSSTLDKGYESWQASQQTGKRQDSVPDSDDPF